MNLFNAAISLVLFVLSNNDEKSFSHRQTTSCAKLSTSTITTSPYTLPVEKYHRMVDWLKSKGATINPNLSIEQSTNGMGYGVFVQANVPKDEILFTVPRDACITLNNAISYEPCTKSFQSLIDKAGPGGNTVVMAGFLAKERLQSIEYANGRATMDSQFGPYIDTLPWTRGTNYQDHILYWSDDEIESFLKGSMCYQEAKELRGEVNLAIRVLDSIMGSSIRQLMGEDDTTGLRWPWEAKGEAKGPVEGLSEAVKGAFVVLLTRAFEDGDGGEEKLVPLLDIMQHSDVPNVSHAKRSSDGTVEVVARCDLQVGEELLNQYRSEMEENMPYHRFFTRFGFVPGIVMPIQDLFMDKSSIFFAQKAEV